MSEQNKDIIRRYYDSMNRGDVAARDTFWAEDIVWHGNQAEGAGQGLESSVDLHDQIKNAFSGLHATIDDMVAEDDKVVARFTATGVHTGPLLGMEPTGKPVTWTGIAIYRIVNEKIAEDWFNDTFNEQVRQLRESQDAG